MTVKLTAKDTGMASGILRSTARVVIGILAIAVAVFFYFRSRSYDTIHPWRGDITEAVYGLGKVKSNQRFEVIVGVVSTVVKRYVNEGDSVKQGAPLIELQNQVLFRAPFTGTVTFVAVYAGETTLPHVPILRLEDLHDQYLELSLEQQAAIRVKVGQPAKVSFESLRGKVLTGRVTAIFPREDEFLARISVSGLESGILPGMTADVSVEIGQIKDALLIPVKAVQNGMVTIRENGRWKKRAVEIGHVDGMNAEVLGNTLGPDDELRLRTGE